MHEAFVSLGFFLQKYESPTSVREARREIPKEKKSKTVQEKSSNEAVCLPLSILDSPRLATGAGGRSRREEGCGLERKN